MKRAIAVCVLAACSGSTTPVTQHDAAVIPPDGTTASDAPAGSFALTSPAFAQGGTIPVANSCNGANDSPQLAWAGAPAAQSFAVVLTDMSNNLVHAVIYDIPGTATGLPAAVEKTYAPANVAGAHQTLAYDNTTRGYLGPCPPNTHTYQFVVYALDAAALPGATMATTRPQAVTLILQHKLASAALTGTFTP